ncbi:MAG: hypothetical protein ABS79_05685 [Planctomycetes bacterium SCN 63-9]|nr:MAG: hypothetical protein ABS79_05685 [Planctomycetes bacterium SCN 63-9]
MQHSSGCVAIAIANRGGPSLSCEEFSFDGPPPQSSRHSAECHETDSAQIRKGVRRFLRNRNRLVIAFPASWLIAGRLD